MSSSSEESNDSDVRGGWDAPQPQHAQVQGDQPGLLQLPARLPHSTKVQWISFRQRFDEFFEAMARTAGGLDDAYAACDEGDQREPPSTSNDMFATGAPWPSTAFICHFLEHAVTRMKGTVNRSGTPTISTVLGLFSCMKLYTSHFTEVPLPSDVSTRIRKWIRNSFPIDLEDTVRPRSLISVSTVKALISILFHPAFLLAAPRLRLQMALWVTMTWQTALRVGSCIPTFAGNFGYRPLVWGDLQVKVCRPPSGSSANSNIVSVTFVPPNAKTELSKNDIELTAEETPWMSPLTYLFPLAVCVGAMESSLVKQLYDPALIPPGDSFTLLTFNKRDQAVFLGSDNVRPWAASSVRAILVRASKALNLPRGLSPHSLRRGSTVVARVMGASIEEIQDQLCHIRSSSGFRMYIGELNSVNVMQHVWGLKDITPDLYHLHPAFLNPGSNPVALSSTERELICCDEDLLSLAAEHDKSLVELLQSHDVSAVSQLPGEEIDKLDTSFSVVAAKYDELYKSASFRPSAESLDYFPSAQDAKYAAMEAINFLSSMQFDDPVAMTELMRVHDDKKIPDAFWEQLLDRAISSSYATTCPTGEIETLASQLTLVSVHDDYEDEDEDDDNFIFNPNGQDEEFEDVVDFTVPDCEDPRLPTYGKNLLLDIGEQLLSASPGISPLDIFDLLSGMPSKDQDIYLFRSPEHEPLDNRCPQCLASESSIVDFSKEASMLPKNFTLMRRKTFDQHIRDCLAQVVLDKVDFDRYPRELDQHPLTGAPLVGADRCVAQVAVTSQNKLIPGERLCKLCNCNVFDIVSLRGHMLLKHATLLPKAERSKAKAAELMKTRWNRSQIPQYLGTSAVWFQHLGRYIIDPEELEKESEKVVEFRLQDAAEGYGVRTDLNWDLSESPAKLIGMYKNRLPSDRKYVALRSRYSRIVRDFLCLICANDYRLPFYKRGHPHNVIPTVSPGQHATSCASLFIKDLVKKGNKHPLATIDGYLCPDPKCQSDPSLDPVPHFFQLLNHLMFVHHFKICGPTIPATGGLASKYVWMSCEEVAKWADVEFQCGYCELEAED